MGRDVSGSFFGTPVVRLFTLPAAVVIVPLVLGVHTTGATVYPLTLKKNKKTVLIDGSVVNGFFVRPSPGELRVANGPMPCDILQTSAPPPSPLSARTRHGTLACSRHPHRVKTCTGPDHPLVRAVGVEPSKDASVEVLNFLLPGDSRRHDGGEGTSGDGGGCTRGYGGDFDESRSAVVFRKWFTVEQQQVGRSGGRVV